MWKNERKAKEKRCVSNKVIYFLPSLCRLQPLKSAVSAEIFPEIPQTRGTLHATFHQFVATAMVSHNPQSMTPNWLPLLKVQLPQREAWVAL